MKDALPCFLVFAGRDNHSRIWNGDSDAGNDLGKSIVVDSVVKLIGIDIVGVFQTRNADRVRTDSERRFQMLGMHEKPGKFIAVFVQSEENTQTDVVKVQLADATGTNDTVALTVQNDLNTTTQYDYTLNTTAMKKTTASVEADWIKQATARGLDGKKLAAEAHAIGAKYMPK